MDGNWRCGAQADNEWEAGKKQRQRASRVIQMPTDTDGTLIDPNSKMCVWIKKDCKAFGWFTRGQELSYTLVIG